MRRTCARPGCHGEAVATLAYDYAQAVVRLETLADEPHPMTHDLCAQHADALRVPRGWTVEDARVPLTLFPRSALAS